MAIAPLNFVLKVTPLAQTLTVLSLGFAAGITSFSAAAIGAEAFDPAAGPLPAMTTAEVAGEAPTAPVLVAELYDLCNVGESTYLVAETENYWVSICGGDAPYTYVGMDKETGDGIEVYLSDYADDGTWFEAVNGDYIYSIIFGTADGSFLTVTEGDETILQEYLVDWE